MKSTDQEVIIQQQQITTEQEVIRQEQERVKAAFLVSVITGGKNLTENLQKIKKIPSILERDLILSEGLYGAAFNGKVDIFKEIFDACTEKEVKANIDAYKDNEGFTAKEKAITRANTLETAYGAKDQFTVEAKEIAKYFIKENNVEQPKQQNKPKKLESLEQNNNERPSFLSKILCCFGGDNEKSGFERF